MPLYGTYSADTSVYANVSTTAYARPTEPGPYTQHGPGDSVEARSNANATHKEGRRIYYLDENDSALKQDIIAAVEETYLSAKKQRYMGFHGVSAKNLMDHLM